MSRKKVRCNLLNNRKKIKQGNRILGNHKGQITVMLSLLLTVILLFLLVCSEGVFLTLSKSRLSRNMITAGESTLADYNLFLWERYHLFALDKTYGGMGEDALTVKLQNYMLQQDQKCQGIAGLYSSSVKELEVKQPLSYCEDIEILKNQIREYMKYKTVQEGWEHLNSIWNENMAKEVDAAKSDVVQAEQRKEEGGTVQESKAAVPDADTAARDTKAAGQETAESKTQLQQTQSKEQDPREELKQALKLDIVELVTGRSDLSKESYGLKNLEQDMKVAKVSEIKESPVSFSSADEILDRLSILDGMNQWGSELSTETLALSYTASHFLSLCPRDDTLSAGMDDASMQCQYEYLIAGKDSDYANAKAIINRLVALRFPLNYIYVIKQPEQVASAQALAVELVGASLNPAAVEVAAYLLLACESYAESILDVRDLVHGGNIPLKKTNESWHVSLTGLASALLEGQGGNQQIDSEDGLSYQDYLALLLAVMPDKEQKYRRMICVMDYEGKKQNPDFAMTNMIAGFYLRMGLHLNPVFCGGAEGLGQSGYTFNYEKMFSY